MNWKEPIKIWFLNRQKVYTLLPKIAYVRWFWIVKFVISGVALYVLTNETFSLIYAEEKEKYHQCLHIGCMWK